MNYINEIWGYEVVNDFQFTKVEDRKLIIR